MGRVSERADILDGSAVEPGMAVLGLRSSGLHSNGYSLARKIIFEEAGLGLDDPLPGSGRTVADELLEPTRIYVKPVLELLRTFRVGAIAHITGGGLLENVPRVLPEGAAVTFCRDRWELPPIFRYLQDQGSIDATGMLRTFNCGIGLVVAMDG